MDIYICTIHNLKSNVYCKLGCFFTTIVRTKSILTYISIFCLCDKILYYDITRNRYDLLENICPLRDIFVLFLFNPLHLI